MDRSKPKEEVFYTEFQNSRSGLEEVDVYNTIVYECMTKVIEGLQIQLVCYTKMQIIYFIAFDNGKLRNNLVKLKITLVEAMFKPRNLKALCSFYYYYYYFLNSL